MQVNTRQAEMAMNGNHSFRQLGFSMLLWRLKRMYGQEPTLDTLKRCTEEINVFLEKYKNIMSADYAIISDL